MKTALSLLSSAFLCAFCIGASAGEESLSPEGKKLIQWGWDEPSPSYLRRNIGRMEKLPFDGVCLRAEALFDDQPVSINYQWFGTYPFKKEQFAGTIQNLKATEFRRFTTNFLQLSTHVGKSLPDFGRVVRGDWWGPDWETVKSNWTIACEMVRDGGLAGLSVDTEQYGPWDEDNPFGLPWNYSRYPNKDRRSFEEVGARIRSCAKELAEIATDVKPDMIISLTTGYTTREHYRWIWYNLLDGTAGPPASNHYGLLSFFGDGLAEGAGPDVTLLDQFSNCKGYMLHPTFVRTRERVRQGILRHSEMPRTAARWRVGFAIKPDWWRYRDGWDEDDFSNNHHTPATWENTVRNALAASEGFVWVYNESVAFWPDSGHVESIKHIMPRQYVDAISRGRVGLADPDWIPDHPSGAAAEPVPRSSSETNDFDAARWELAQDYEILREISDGWKVFIDVEDAGDDDTPYFRFEKFPDQWQPIRVGEYLERQEHRRNGTAWYRVFVNVTDRRPDREIAVAFLGVGGQARVWVNHTMVAAHDGPGTFVTPDLTERIDDRFFADRPACLVLRTFHKSGPGGVFGPVYLVTPRVKLVEQNESP